METCFPIEIWEAILQCLPFPDLLRAACVCCQWRHLARRICRMRCQYLPQRLLLELTYECTTTTTTSNDPLTPPPKPLRYCSPPSNTNNTTTTTSDTSKNSLDSLLSSNFPPSSHVSPSCSSDVTTNHSSSSSSSLLSLSSSLVHINTPNSRQFTDTHRLSTAPSHDAVHLRPDDASSPTSLSPQESRTPPPFYLDNTSTAQCPSEDNMAECPGEGSVDWLQVTKMLLQTRLTTRPQDCSVIKQAKGVTILASSGGFLIVVERVGDGEGVVRVVGEEGRECHHALPGTINKVCVLEGGSEPTLVALCVERELRCLLVAPKLQSLTPLPLSPRLTVDSRLCCEGRTLVVSQMNEEYNLSVFRASVVGVGVVEGEGVELTLLARINTATPPLSWDLWNGFVTTLVSSGHVLTYTLMGTLVGESPLYKDLRYPNPTLLSRGLVFSSTITSRALLSYWHMDRDRDFWLLGESVLTSWVQRGAGAVGNASCKKDSSISSSGRQGSDVTVAHDKGSVISPVQYMEPSSSCMLSLAKVRVGAAVLQEVTVIHYRRGLVFCGTSQGHLLVYKILHEEGGLNNNYRHGGGGGGVAGECQQRSPLVAAGDHRQLSSTSGRNYNNERINWGVMECCLPSLCLALAHRPVSRLTSHFAVSSVIVGVADRDGNCQVVSIPYTDSS